MGIAYKKLHTSYGEAVVSILGTRRGARAATAEEKPKQHQPGYGGKDSVHVRKRHKCPRAHIRIYALEVPDPIASRITGKILPMAKEWQQRPPESIYAVVFLDVIHYHHVAARGKW